MGGRVVTRLTAVGSLCVLAYGLALLSVPAALIVAGLVGLVVAGARLGAGV